MFTEKYYIAKMSKMLIYLRFYWHYLRILVELVGIEPTTSCLQSRCSPSWAIAPKKQCREFITDTSNIQQICFWMTSYAYYRDQKYLFGASSLSFILKVLLFCNISQDLRINFIWHISCINIIVSYLWLVIRFLIHPYSNHRP